MESEVEEKLFIIDFLKCIANIIEKGGIITLLRKGTGPGDLHCFGPALHEAISKENEKVFTVKRR